MKIIAEKQPLVNHWTDVIEFLSSGSVLKLPLLLIQHECKIRNFSRSPAPVRVLLSK